MKRIGKRILCALLTAALAFTGAWLLPVGWSNEAAGWTAYAAEAATPAKGDTIYFGHYPQGLVDQLDPATEPTTGTPNVDWVSQTVKLYSPSYTEKFHDPEKGSTAYYRIEPIAWLVLKNADGQLLLMAKKALDAKPYHKEDVNRTWETCTLRSWLNGYSKNSAGASVQNPDADSFMGKAFTNAEKNAVATTEVLNISRGTDAGKDTDDKVFLLSRAEVTNPSYGFDSYAYNYDPKRLAQTTPFARAHGAFADTYQAYSENGEWWLRTPGDEPFEAFSVKSNAQINSQSRLVNEGFLSVRPVLYLNMESVNIASRTDGAWDATAIDISIADAEVTCSPSAAMYTGSPITPAVTIKLGGKELANGADYTLSFANNTAPGTATVTATAKPGSGYTGSTSTTFAITPKPTQLDTAQITTVSGRAWTGSLIKPVVKVTLDGKTLTANTDYTVAYTANKTIGKATITIAGNGSYTGTKTATFKITPKKVALKSVKAGKKSVKVTWAKAAAKQQLTGYQIRYRYKAGKKWSKWKTKTVKISYKATAKTIKTTVKKLKRGKTYQVQIRAYKVIGKGNAKQYYYSKWGKSKKTRTR